MRALWSQGETTFEGSHYTVRGARCDPRPVLSPNIIIGGGSKRILTVAAEQADTVGVSTSRASEEKDGDQANKATLDHFDRCLSWVRAAAGDRFVALELQITASAMVVSSRRAAARSATMLGFPGEEALDLPILLIGTEDEICERLFERRERWGFNNVVVPGESMESFAPIVARMAGL